MKRHHFIKRSQAIILRRILSVVGILSLAIFSQPLSSDAALTTPHLYLSRQQGSLTTGESFQLFFTTGSAVNGGAGVNKVILTFTGANGSWCNTVGTGDLVVTGIANPTGATETATQLPGTSKTAACTQNPDTFTISGVDNLTATTKYGVQIVEASSTKIGSAAAAANLQVTVKTNNGSTDIDTATLAVATIANDQVSVSATVNPTLTVTLSGNSVALGTLTTSNNSFSGITSQVTTNATSGYVSLVNYGATLTGPTTIADVTGSPPDNMAAGTAAYGASSSASGNTIGQFDSDSNTCDGTTRTTANPVSATALSASFKSFASSGSAVSGQTTTLCFLATVAATTPGGTYTSTSTLVTTAKY